MPKALYRKYRPTKLSEVVGEDQVTTVLSNAIKSKKISHAYLFIGPRGCGKTSVARILAHEVNNFNYELEDDYVDIIEIDAASNTGVDNIRELREKAAIAPTKGKYKVYIIDEVHMLSKSAFNALLKILEEPPEHVIFIMATTDAYKVPITITSRSQVFTFKLATPETMLNHLKNICELEKIDIEDEALKIIVDQGGGSFRDSLSLLDQISSLSESKITKNLIIESFGLPEDAMLNKLLESYASQNSHESTSILKTLFEANTKPEIIVEKLLQKIIANPLSVYIPLLSTLPEVYAPFPEAKLLSAFLISQTTAIAPPAPQKPTIQKTQLPKVEPSKTEEKEVKPTPAPVSTPVPSQTGIFSWETFLEQVRELNDAIYSQLTKTTQKFENNTLHIYPERKITQTILARDKNKAILISASTGFQIKIHDFSEKQAEKDPLVSQISDIMGGAEEVKNNGGESPF